MFCTKTAFLINSISSQVCANGCFISTTYSLETFSGDQIPCLDPLSAFCKQNWKMKEQNVKDDYDENKGKHIRRSRRETFKSIMGAI